MQIIGGDFNLKKDGDNYTLYIMNKNGKAKLGGYFTTPLNAFKWVFKWRKDKKYPHKQSLKDIAVEIKRYKESKKKLHKISKLVYKPVTKLDQKINGIRGIYDKSGSKSKSYSSGAPK